MNTGNDFADASLDTGLVSEIGDILPSFSNDNASVFCRYESTKGERVVGCG
jgi:hypothetical protein